MLSVLVALVLLIVCVAAIYLLLKNMGENGIEVAAPGSCRSGSCGVRKGESHRAGCHQEEIQPDEADEIDRLTTLKPQLGGEEQQGGRPG